MSDEVQDSILQSIKKNLNISPEDTAFDVDIIMQINSAFATLYQLGVGPDTPFSISDDSETWDMFSTDPELNGVQRYIWLKTKIVFDPPTGSVMTEYTNQLKEEEWRLTIAAEELRKSGSNG